MLISKVLVTTLLSASLWAFDSTDYSVTMAEDHIKNGNPEEAIKVLEESLEEDTDNQKLVALINKAQAALKEKKERQKKDEHQRQVQQQLKIRKEQQARQADEERTRIEEKKARPEFLRRALCDCQQQKIKAQNKVRDEKSAADISGVVDKVTLYEAGKTILNLDKTIKHLRSEMSKDGVTDLGCDGRMPSSGWSTPCSDYFFQNSTAIKGQ